MLKNIFLGCLLLFVAITGFTGSSSAGVDSAESFFHPITHEPTTFEKAKVPRDQIDDTCGFADLTHNPKLHTVVGVVYAVTSTENITHRYEAWIGLNAQDEIVGSKWLPVATPDFVWQAGLATN